MEEALRLLSDDSRRQISQELANSRLQEVGLGQLSKILVESQGINRDTARINLRQVHLPKMEQYGLIEFDKDQDSVFYNGDEVIEGFHDEFEDLSTMDDTLALLSDDYRRQISYNFVESGREEVSVEELQDYLVEGMGVDDGTARLQLLHVDLPKMDADGLVSHDREEGVVTYDADEETRRFISRLREFEQRYEVPNVQ